MEQQYFTAEESISLLGKPITFRNSKSIEVEGKKYPTIHVGTPGEVFNITNLPEGIVIGVFVDDDIEEFTKDQFYHYCELNHASAG
jgi:hypothetical protein